jgi:uncharacterized protein (TIGR02147 family)
MLGEIFSYSDYRLFLKAHILAMPEKGRGQLTKVASHLNVHPSLFGQILAGKKQLTSDQAFQVCDYLQLSELETDYFGLLVELERTGVPARRVALRRKLEHLKETALGDQSSNIHDHPLNISQQTIYYSSWHFVAVSLLAALSDFQNLDWREKMAARLGLSKSTIQQAASFLVAAGICEEKDGALRRTILNTHLEQSSPLIARHLTNWRLRGIELIPSAPSGRNEIFHTAPLTIDRKTQEKMRVAILNLIEKSMQAPSGSASTSLMCLNIDWFEI